MVHFQRRVYQDVVSREPLSCMALCVSNDHKILVPNKLTGDLFELLVPFCDYRSFFLFFFGSVEITEGKEAVITLRLEREEGASST